MKIKEIFITSFLTLIVCLLFAANYIGNKFILRAENVYEVYLNGNIVGFILDDDELYELINEKQQEIKEKYSVDKVYPPDNFQIIETNSYDVEISSAESIYAKMAEMGSFTIEGYTITIKTEVEKTIEEKYIYVLNEEIFDKAINDFILAFISEDDYNNYINDTQPVIETTGKTITSMYFDEAITIKKGYISVNNQIFVDETSLSQYLLFGEDAKINSYVVKAGDTIESISNENKLNTQEFLIANPEYVSSDSLLKIGDKVNITLINPVITLSYQINEVSDTEIPYEKKVVRDSSKSASYSDITTAGVTGITRISTKYLVKNGETQQGAVILSQDTIVEKVDQVTTIGGVEYYTVIGNFVDTGSYWAWPTNRPYIITSLYGYRWGTLHEGIDISGTGFGSPIYASYDGVVISSGWEGKCGYGGGYCIVLEHPNGYYTIYAHMAQGSLQVSEGDTVTKGQVIGGMGSTGYSTGYHLHFGVWYGYPYQSTSHLVNPLSLWS